MLYTNLKHIEKAEEYSRVIGENEYVTMICGRMDPFSVPVYRIAEELEETYPHVAFYDVEVDNPETVAVLTLSEVREFKSIPYVLYYKNGNVVKATSGPQSKEQIISILDKEFASTVEA